MYCDVALRSHIQENILVGTDRDEHSNNTKLVRNSVQLVSVFVYAQTSFTYNEFR